MNSHAVNEQNPEETNPVSELKPEPLGYRNAIPPIFQMFLAIMLGAGLIFAVLAFGRIAFFPVKPVAVPISPEFKIRVEQLENHYGRMDSALVRIEKKVDKNEKSIDNLYKSKEDK